MIIYFDYYIHLNSPYSKVMSDSVAIWIPLCGFRISGPGFLIFPQLDSVWKSALIYRFKRNFFHSKAQDSRLQKEKKIMNTDYLTWVD